MDFTSLRVVVSCVGDFSKENTRMLDMRVAVLVPIVSQINMKSGSSRNDKQYALAVPLLYSIYWLLHVSALACHHYGAS
jgi:hypothetical protein